MRHGARLARLEARLPEDKRPWHERLFSFRVAGTPRVHSIVKMMRRLKLAIDDPRATQQQRLVWMYQIRRCVPALEYELSRMQTEDKPLPDLSDIRALEVLSPKWQHVDS